MQRDSSKVLIISGFDATGSAGVLLDAHICHTLGVESHCILSSLLIQNHNIVQHDMHLNKQDIINQLKAIDTSPLFVKIGLLQSTEVITVIANYFKQFPNVKIIADTPLTSSSGKKLVEDIPAYIQAFIKHILPITDLLTPNLDEIKAFGTIHNILANGCKNILLKGGHSNGKDCIDVLSTQNHTKHFSTPRINFLENVRGTGCALSTAITCYYAKGLSLEEAISSAKKFVYNGIKNSVKVNDKTRVMRLK